MATRERLIEQPLPALEGQMKMPFPAMELSNRGWFKVFGVVTNRTLAGDEVIWWSRQRCGKGEEVHSVLKSDLAGGRLPSRLFGANAAWWAIAVLAFNLSSAMKRLVLGGQWVSRRLKAVRFALIALPGRVMRHAKRLIIRLSRDHPSYELLLRARQNILALKVCAGRIRTNVPALGYNIQSLFRILPQHTVALRCAKSLGLPQNGFLRGNQS